MDWNGKDDVSPISFSGVYSLRFNNFYGLFGFQTNTNLYGISSAGLVNQWHFVTAVMVNGDVTQDQLWIDGVEQVLEPSNVPLSSYPLGSFNVSTSPYIGCFPGPDGPGTTLGGALDDVAFFHQQLTAAQIQAEYAASLNGTVSATILSQGPVAYYPLNETSGSVAYDASGNGSNGAVSANGIVLGVVGGPTGNHSNGVSISGSASGNTIGGTPSGARNLISGNGSSGVMISDSGTSGNVVENNFIGLDVTGRTTLANTNDGVLVTNGATGNTIGDATGGTRNVLSGNRGNGVEISGPGTSENQVAGNIIGLDVSGSTAVGADGQPLGNRGIGVEIHNGAADNTIGGLTSTPGTGAGNVISGNNIQQGPFQNVIGAGGSSGSFSSYGLVIAGSGTSGNVVEGNIVGLDATGTKDVDANGIFLGNVTGVGVESGTTGNTIGGTTTGARNVISGNILHGGDGVELGGSNNLVAGNFIGTDITGTVALGNGYYGGILVTSSASDDTIGGTTPNARNIIGGNAGPNVSWNNFQPTNILIEGNYIGTDVTGDVALGGGGIDVAGDDNTIGGTTPGAGNIIGSGIVLSGTSENNLVQGNIIGLGANGNPLPNGGSRLFITGNDNTIGGTAPGAGNVLSDSGGGYGVYIAGPSAPNQALYPVTGNLVVGNEIEGNHDGGVRIDGAAADNTIGDTAAGAGNVITDNGGPGIAVSDSGTTGNVVESNFIGTNTSETANLGNAGPGVLIENGAAGNTVGGTASGAGNTIASNTAGVVVQGTNTTGDAILGDSIHDNGGLGINLDGGNENQAAPVLTSARSSSSGTTVSGTFESVANTTFRIEFFSNAGLDTSGNAEGLTYLGFTTVTTDSNGHAAFTAANLAAIPAGQGYLTATATNQSTGDTSPFSNYLTAPTSTLLTSSANPSVFGQPVTFTATVSSSFGTPTGSVDFVDTTTNTDLGTRRCV
jgi:titin